MVPRVIAPNPLAALYRCDIFHPKWVPLYVSASVIINVPISDFLSEYHEQESKLPLSR